jgi:creatinine amidohydrolase
MMTTRRIAFLGTLVVCAVAFGQNRGVRLEDLTWKQAAEVLTQDAIVVIPLGAASKEHGPHLKLSNDLIIAEYLSKQVLERSKVVMAPVVNYHYYPAFVEFPGATSLRFETAKNLIVDICKGLAQFGPRKFYVLNTGVSTVRPLTASMDELAAAEPKITMRFTNILNAAREIEKQIAKQPEGTHADEMETSMMLYMAPHTVDMSKATKDFPKGTGPMQWRNPQGSRYSASGIYGDATLATREKGEKIVRAQVDFILREIEELRRLP